MTIAEREAIFSKEVLTIEDFEKLFHCSYDTASKKIREIKAKSDRLGVSGICHIQDYIDAYGLDVRRYLMPKKERPYEERERIVAYEEK